MQNLKNDELNNLINDKDIINYIKAQRLSSFGHVYQIINDRMVKELCEWIQILFKSLAERRKNWMGKRYKRIFKDCENK